MSRENNNSDYFDVVHLLYDSMMEFKSRLIKINNDLVNLQFQIKDLEQDILCIEQNKQLKEVFSKLQQEEGVYNNDSLQIQDSGKAKCDTQVENTSELDVNCDVNDILYVVDESSTCTGVEKIVNLDVNNAETKLPLTSEVDGVDSKFLEKDERIEEVPFEERELYYGAPSGSGFEFNDTLSKDSLKVLYVIKQIASDRALFYPLSDKISRFKNNIGSLLEPVCEIHLDMNAIDSFTIDESDYGVLTLENNNYWKVSKMCVLKM